MPPAGWDTPNTIPLPPMNGQVVPTYLQGSLDIRWDDPALLAGNANFQVVGVNLYRSDVSDRGPFVRINPFPVTSSFFRDRSDLIKISKEIIRWDVSWLERADAPNARRWTFKTTYPIAKPTAQGPWGEPVYGNSAADVTVYIDGQVVPVEDVFGRSGEVRLINRASWEPGTEKFSTAVLPTASSVVEVSYSTYRSYLRSDLDAKIIYRLATVVLDPTTPSGLRETPLSYCPPVTNIAVETLDYIWREAVRRNRWILEQGGERVKLFIRKQSGIPCACRIEPRTREYAHQPSSRCQVCYGAGFVDGYEGPWDIIIAPEDGDHKISQTPTGRRLEFSYEVFTGPTPLVTQRDFVVKQTNERYSIGPVRRPSNRGNVLQQHFTIASLDEQDIRYLIPIDGLSANPWPRTRLPPEPYPHPAVDGSLPLVEGGLEPQAPIPVGTDTDYPMATDHPSTPDEREIRGRTPVWENINE